MQMDFAPCPKLQHGRTAAPETPPIDLAKPPAGDHSTLRAWLQSELLVGSLDVRLGSILPPICISDLSPSVSVGKSQGLEPSEGSPGTRAVVVQKL